MSTCRLLALSLAALMLTGCLNMNGVSGRERTEYLASIKPYGAHWIKDGMTQESRRIDFGACGGSSADYRQGYEIQAGQSTNDFFKAFDAHVKKLRSCMQSKDYVYTEQCDARCMYP